MGGAPVGSRVTVLAAIDVVDLSFGQGLTVGTASSDQAMATIDRERSLGAGLGTLFNIAQLTLRQAITPARLQGRMNAIVRFMYWSPQALGAAIGGAIANWLAKRRQEKQAGDKVPGKAPRSKNKLMLR